MVGAGPKIWLLLPAWLLGVGVYHHRRELGEAAALALFVATILLALTFIQLDISVAIRHRMTVLFPATMVSLQGANQFVGDWLFALIISANFMAAASVGRFGAPLRACARPITIAAGYTFSSYLYHMPLLALAVLGLGLSSWPALLGVGIAVVALAQLSERQLPAARGILRWMAAPRPVLAGGVPKQSP